MQFFLGLVIHHETLEPRELYGKCVMAMALEVSMMACALHQ